jgi:hypothetical protein
MWLGWCLDLAWAFNTEITERAQRPQRRVLCGVGVGSCGENALLRFGGRACSVFNRAWVT